MRVEFDAAQVTAARIEDAVAETGLKLEPWRERAAELSFWDRHGRIVLVAISGACLLGAALWQAVTTGDFVRFLLAHEHAGHHASWPVLLLSAGAILSGAYFVLPKALYSFRRFQPDMNALVIVSLVGAAYLGEWIEGATLSFLFALAALLETYSMARAGNAVRALMEFSPGEAAVVHHDHEHRMPASQVKIGSIVRVRPGERIPCDGEVVSGGSDVNQSAITGESAPVWKSAGDAVFAGTMNGDGVIELRTSKVASDTTLARIVRMVENVQHRRGTSERWVERFSRVYTPLIMLLAMAVAVGGPVVFGHDWGDSFYQGMVILLISCPCALVISTPVSVVAALASAARHGVLIKGGAFLEDAARLRVVAIDKTGVLTRGEPRVRAMEPLNGFDQREVLKRLAALESRSGHPVARAILHYAREQGVAPAGVASFQTLQGRGAEAEIGGERFWAGSLRLLKEKGLDKAAVGESRIRDSIAEFAEREETVMACGTQGAVWALVALEDPVRPEAPEAVASLRRHGIDSVVMLTGDNSAVASRVGLHVGVDDVRADLLPEDKATAVAAIQRERGPVAMVGDGVNDAQAMTEASLGIAVAGPATDVAMETADIVLMSGDLRKLGFLLAHSRRAVRVIQQNVALALAMKGVFFVLAFLGVATLWMAVAADMGATLLVTFNGLRLLRADEANPA